MTPKQIAYLEETMKPGFYPAEFRTYINGFTGEEVKKLLTNYENQKKDPIWRQAFDEYNEHNYRLSTGCFQCYAKVLMWHKRQLINESKFAIKDGKHFKTIKVIKS